ncbi:hypothetical protein DVJ78_16885 [Humibacter sp. BT305]|nr:hypothetical protein DVJ78_16885 [Humibacter sp. BT305]
MAGQEHVIDAPIEERPWPLVIEIAEATSEGSWVMVGGMMVHAHALRSGVNASRPTRDVDIILDLESRRVSDVAGPLHSLGFEAQTPSITEHLHRFRRADDVVDVMVRTGVSARWRRSPLLPAPAATQALARRDRYIIRTAGPTVGICVPDALGAIVSKSAAYAVDGRNRDRHLEDLAVLYASSGPPSSLGLSRLTARDRTLLSPASALLDDFGHPAWSVLDRVDMVRGQRSFSALRETLV